MNVSLRLLTPVVALILPAALLGQAPAKLASFADFQARAAKANCVLQLPKYPLTPDEVRTSADQAIKAADAALAKLVAQDPAKLTFTRTIAD